MSLLDDELMSLGKEGVVQGQPVGTSILISTGRPWTSSSLCWVKLWLRETENKVSLAEGRASQLQLPGRGGLMSGVELLGEGSAGSPDRKDKI